MSARLIKMWQDLQGSYYFIPGLMAFGAIFLAYVTISLDEIYGLKVSDDSIFFLSNKATGARTILATIAGSMIGVAATTFSITMVAVTSAAGQYGPRLIGNFMRDRGNQVTLGTFTSTFIYCLLILRVARTGDGTDAQDAIAEFVPNISLLVAMGLTLMSVGVLIYFIHHIPEILNVGNITSRVGRRLSRDIENRYPKNIGRSKRDSEINLKDYKLSDAQTIRSKFEGFVQTLNEKALLDLCVKLDVVAKIEYRPGDFVTKGDILVRIWGEDSLSEEQELKFLDGFATGNSRSAHQNILFLADELVEILARALSPGVNDPFTAINCINWFHSSMKSFAAGDIPSPCRYDETGKLRLIAYPVTFESFVQTICNQSRAYIATDRNTTIKMMTILTEMTAIVERDEHKACIMKQLEDLKFAAEELLPSEVDKAEVRKHYNVSKKMIADPAYFLEQEHGQHWVAGRG
ncbi:DUF2254 domain-containing protein [Litorimonas haliclonae]|uniref:DUF2254 domain-containing protein n=1 Tax=Litorimonas haliclonae TaxID=2081977 RepID=UPI0039EED2E3